VIRDECNASTYMYLSTCIREWKKVGCNKLHVLAKRSDFIVYLCFSMHIWLKYILMIYDRNACNHKLYKCHHTTRRAFNNCEIIHVVSHSNLITVIHVDTFNAIFEQRVKAYFLGASCVCEKAKSSAFC